MSLRESRKFADRIFVAGVLLLAAALSVAQIGGCDIEYQEFGDSGDTSWGTFQLFCAGTGQYCDVTIFDVFTDGAWTHTMDVYCY